VPGLEVDEPEAFFLELDAGVAALDALVSKGFVASFFASDRQSVPTDPDTLPRVQEKSVRGQPLRHRR